MAWKASGVQTIWIVDPETRTGRVCSGRHWTQTSRLEVSGTPICLDLDTLLQTLDRRGNQSNIAVGVPGASILNAVFPQEKRHSQTLNRAQ